MDNFKTLLVGLDLTESDSLLLRYTASFCSQVGSIEKVYFVHNIKIGYDSEELALFSELERPIEEIIAEELEERVERFFEISQPAINYEVLVTKQSYTPTALAQLATKQDADLILMGKKTAYRGSGIVVEKLLRIPSLKASVLLVPNTAPQQLRHIIASVDFSRASGKAMLRAQALMEVSGAALTPLHVVHIPAHYFPYIPGDNMKEKAIKKAQEKYKKFVQGLNGSNLSEQDCRIIHKQDQSIARNIYSEALQLGGDLIVTGSVGHSTVETMLLGSVTQRLIGIDSHVPLLVVRDKSEK